MIDAALLFLHVFQHADIILGYIGKMAELIMRQTVNTNRADYACRSNAGIVEAADIQQIFAPQCHLQVKIRKPCSFHFPAEFLNCIGSVCSTAKAFYQIADIVEYKYRAVIDFIIILLCEIPFNNTVFNGVENFSVYCAVPDDSAPNFGVSGKTLIPGAVCIVVRLHEIGKYRIIENVPKCDILSTWISK